jgi:hypothetical protein
MVSDMPCPSARVESLALSRRKSERHCAGFDPIDQLAALDSLFSAIS